MKKFLKKLVLSMLSLTVFLFSNNIQVHAEEKSHDAESIVPMTVQYCLVHGAKHRADSKSIAKVKIDGDSTIYSFTRGKCQCGAEIFYDGYPNSGYVGNYFQYYYKTAIDPFYNFTVFYVNPQYLYSEYSSGNLIDWQLSGY